MVCHVAWAITGAGHFLNESFDVISKLLETKKITVTTFLSAAGNQVINMYGLQDKLDQVSPDGYLQEIISESSKDPGFSHSGRFILGEYDMLVVSPATGNTIAKIVYGIADSLVTNLVAQAQKAKVPVYVVPTDQKEGYVKTTLPYRIDKKSCKQCTPCSVVDVCSYSAIKISDGTPKISSVLCQGCGLCLDACPYDAVKFGEKKKLWIRTVDAQNVEKLQLMNNLSVLENPQQLQTVIEKLQKT
ncbi:MAG: dihydromethanopterin reductase (acceptor) [Candidatus Bathyarchaeota archaeon]|nr:dihydromethanopterin reductase (acceptor) [Candidatus Bathyarchaeum tardum]